MDAESRTKFEEVTKTLGQIKTSVAEGVAYNKGLDVKNRLINIESNVDDLSERKASWNGLYLSLTLAIAFCGLVVIIIKAV